MKALLTDNRGKVWLQDMARPALDDYDCLVRMEACLFCHSTDRHIVEGTFVSSFHNPSVLGHESVGVIEQVGAAVRHRAPGDRVLRAYAIYPGEVLEDIGSGWGGFAEFGKVRDAQAMVDDGLMAAGDIPHGFGYMQQVPADISLEKSLLLITQKEIYSASSSIAEVAEKRFVVAGAGITGCLFGMFLKWRGAAQVTMAARRRAPLDFAVQHGCADEGVLLSDVGRLQAHYDGLVETTGSLSAAGALADTLLADRGTIYSYAVYEGMTREGFFDDLSARHRFMRIAPAEATAHEAAVAMVREGRFEPAPFVTGRFGISDWEAAWRSVVERTSLKTAIFFA